MRGNRVDAGRPPASRWASVLALSLVLLFGAAPIGAEDTEELDPLFDDLFDEDFADVPSGYPDPLEETNRGVFAFNRQVDRWILDPITEAYRWVVPQPARQALSNMFDNLGSTKTLMNDFLQLEWKDAGVTGTRLVVNTSVGVLGHDPARHITVVVLANVNVPTAARNRAATRLGVELMKLARALP